MSMVSIVMPTYKGSDKILLPLYGALTQTYPNTEVIVVDDNGCGTAEQIATQQVLQPLIDRGDIVYIAHAENKNGSAARNTGFRAAKGEFITFLDDDDVILPTKLERQMAVMCDPLKPADVVICGSYFVHENGRGIKTKPSWNPAHIQRDYLLDKMHFNTSAILLRKEVVERIGGFDESFRRHQDWEFCLRLMQFATFATVEEYLVIKYATGRNMAGSPEKAVAFYEHFRKKMQPYFNTLTDSDQMAIKRFQSKRLMKTFIYAKKLKGLRSYMRSCGLSIFSLAAVMVDICTHVIKRYTRGNCQHVNSWQRYMQDASAYFEKLYQPEVR